jgi:hypothetical protein
MTKMVTKEMLTLPMITKEMVILPMMILAKMAMKPIANLSKMVAKVILAKMVTNEWQ